jgi:hypothetical protein
LGGRSAYLGRRINLDVFVFITAFILNETHIDYLVVVVAGDKSAIGSTWLSNKVDDLQVKTGLRFKGVTCGQSGSHPQGSTCRPCCLRPQKKLPPAGGVKAASWTRSCRGGSSNLHSSFEAPSKPPYITPPRDSSTNHDPIVHCEYPEEDRTHYTWPSARLEFTTPNSPWITARKLGVVYVIPITELWQPVAHPVRT